MHQKNDAIKYFLTHCPSITYISNKCLLFNSKLDVIAIMAKGPKDIVDEPKLTVVGSIHRHNPIEKSRLAFFINENGDLSIHRELASSLHKLAFSALLENEAKLLRAEAVSECGLGAYSAA